MTRAGSFLWILVGLALHGSAVANTLANPDFDTGLSGRSAFGGTWSPFDLDGDPNSGSALLSGTDQLSQCVPVVPGTIPTGGASVFVPSGQSGSANVFVSVTYFQGDDCFGLGSNVQLFVNLVPLDTWTFVAASALPEVPAGFASGNFRLDFLSEQGEFEAYFDAARLRFVPEPVQILLSTLIAAGILCLRRCGTA